MSDTPQAADWFQASDGKWYPPTTVPPPPEALPLRQVKRSGGDSFLLVGFVMVGLAIVAIVIASAVTGGGGSSTTTTEPTIEYKLAVIDGETPTSPTVANYGTELNLLASDCVESRTLIADQAVFTQGELRKQGTNESVLSILRAAQQIAEGQPPRPGKAGGAQLCGFADASGFAVAADHLDALLVLVVGLVFLASDELVDLGEDRFVFLVGHGGPQFVVAASLMRFT